MVTVVRSRWNKGESITYSRRSNARFGIAGIQVTAVLPFDFESEVKASSSSDNQDINEAFKRALQKLDEEEFDELDEEARRINGGAVGGSCFERARIFAFDTPFMVENNARREDSDGNNNGVYNDLRSRGRRRLTLATKKAFQASAPGLKSPSPESLKCHR